MSGQHQVNTITRKRTVVFIEDGGVIPVDHLGDATSIEGSNMYSCKALPNISWPVQAVQGEGLIVRVTDGDGVKGRMTSAIV